MLENFTNTLNIIQFWFKIEQKYTLYTNIYVSLYLAVHKYKKYDILQFTTEVRKRRRLADYEKSTVNTVEKMARENVKEHSVTIYAYNAAS